jgi:hypothetical protein
MPKDEQAILEQLNKVFSTQVPNSRTITREVLVESLADHQNATWIKKHFSYLIETLQVTAYERYLQHEREAWRVAFASVFGPKLQECSTPDKVAGVIGDYFFTLDRFFLSRTQSRRSRAGIAFEVVLEELFTKLRYPFESQPEIDGNPDFVFPSISLYRNNAQDAIVFTAKRTLRERWRQIVTEGAKGLGFFLATIDEEVSAVQIREMKGARIQLVVPSRLKESVQQYAAAANVVTFEDFLEDHLDPKMTKWKKHGDIS